MMDEESQQLRYFGTSPFNIFGVFFRSSENVNNLYILIWQILEHVQVNFGDVKCPGESDKIT